MTTVVDSAAPGRQGRNTGGRSGRTGRFAHAFGFGPDKSLVTVDDAPAFALPATAALTVEAVVRTDRTTTTGAVVAKRRKLNTRADAGWSLTVGTFRGIDRNVRFSLSDGSTEAEVFADRDLGDGAFHHIAGALSRADGASTVLLHVDGKEVARQPLKTPLGALTSTAELVIGRGTEARETATSPRSTRASSRRYASPARPATPSTRSPGNPTSSTAAGSGSSTAGSCPPPTGSRPR